MPSGAEMTTRSYVLKLVASIALVVMIFAGLASCGGGGSGGGSQVMIMPPPSQGESPSQDEPPSQGKPDLVVAAPLVSNGNPVAGAGFTLSATVSNTGDGASATTTLRFYRSTDSDVTTSDTAVGTAVVAGLVPSGSVGASVDLTAPTTPGTYYYGACVDAVTGESDTTNNCSASVQVDVAAPSILRPQQQQPDLAVVAFFLASGVHDGAPGRSLTFQGRIRNVGNVMSPATTLRFYRSRNRTIATDDTFLGTVAVGTIAASRRIDSETLTLTAPSAPGTYYYGACVDAVTDESDTNNNCSDARPITVDGPPPDLVVTGPNVSEIQEDGTFWLIVTVSNQGAGGAAATTVRYKRSTDGTITTSDTTVGTDAVNTLFPAGGYGATIKLTAPTTPSAYYYGGCVDAVPRESDTTNNCSASVQVRVQETQPPVQGNPDLIFIATVVGSGLSGGEFSVRFSIVIGNDGDGASAPSKLRYYRSTDATITTSDTELGMDAVPGLAVMASSNHTRDVNPPSPGTYYYGACVDAVARESDTTNNCSSGARVVVPEP